FQDNRIVPYEGLRASALSARQQRDLMDLVAAYVAPLPRGPLAARLAEVERHLADSWIGGFEETRPVYYRIQSPVGSSANLLTLLKMPCYKGDKSAPCSEAKCQYVRGSGNTTEPLGRRGSWTFAIRMAGADSKAFRPSATPKNSVRLSPRHVLV